MLRKEDDVLVAIAHRWNGEDVEREPIEKVVTKRALSRRPRQVHVGGAHHPEVNRLGGTAPDALEFTVFDDPQDLLLGTHARVGDLVQKQGALVRRLESTGPPARGSGERASLFYY